MRFDIKRRTTKNVNGKITADFLMLYPKIMWMGREIKIFVIEGEAMNTQVIPK